jgi:hypothetical protein
MKEYTVKIYENEAKEWYLNGKLHREDGPAYEGVDGTKIWYLNDKLHREDGPAYEGTYGTKEWFLNGLLHREDGPAYEGADGTKVWYLNGVYHTEEEFNKKMKKPCKIDSKVVEIDGKKYKLTEI